MLRQKASVELRDSYVVGCLVINVVVLCNRIFSLGVSKWQQVPLSGLTTQKVLVL